MRRLPAPWTCIPPRSPACVASSYETVRRTLKKRAQAVAEGAVVHPARSQRRVRLAHGGRAGGLPPPATIRGGRWSAWTRPAARCSARPASAPRRPGPPGAARLRVRPQRHGQPVPGQRAAARVAAGERQRPAHPHRLGALHPGAGRRALPEAERIVLVMDNLNTHSPGLAVRGVPARPRPSGWPTSWRSTTPPSTAVG